MKEAVTSGPTRLGLTETLLIRFNSQLLRLTGREAQSCCFEERPEGWWFHAPSSLYPSSTMRGFLVRKVDAGGLSATHQSYRRY